MMLMMHHSASLASLASPRPLTVSLFCSAPVNPTRRTRFATISPHHPNQVDPIEFLTDEGTKIWCSWGGSECGNLPKQNTRQLRRASLVLGPCPFNSLGVLGEAKGVASQAQQLLCFSNIVPGFVYFLRTSCKTETSILRRFCDDSSSCITTTKDNGTPDLSQRIYHSWYLLPESMCLVSLSF